MLGLALALFEAFPWPFGKYFSYKLKENEKSKREREREQIYADPTIEREIERGYQWPKRGG